MGGDCPFLRSSYWYASYILESNFFSTLLWFLFFPQDDANKMGGKWIIRLRKGLASRCWENLILAMLGEQFMVGEEICGAVVSVRFQVNH